MSKLPISIRLDSQVLSWFREQFPHGYQAQINTVLKQYKESQISREAFLLGRAQQIYQQYFSRCFWHMKRDLQITHSMIPMIQEGLRKFGGREGYLLADELEN